MPPQAKEPATGFRYTPSSYLQRTRIENRPWTGDDDDVDQELEALAALKQEERPPRMHPTIDANFNSRIQRRKDLYRGIIKGDLEVEPMSESDDALEHSMHLLEDSDLHPLERPMTPSFQAREARQRRLKGAPSSSKPTLSSTSGKSKEDSEAARVRNMRAERLRQLKRLSADEQDFGEILRLRRLAHLEQDRLEKERQLKEEEAYWNEQKRLEKERATLAEERRQFEQARRLAARELEDKRRRRQQQKEKDQKKQQKEKEEKKQQKAKCASPPRNRPKRSSSVTALPEFSLFEEVQLMVRDSGLLRTCVTSCFGVEGDYSSEARNAGKKVVVVTNDLELSEETSEPGSFAPPF